MLLSYCFCVQNYCESLSLLQFWLQVKCNRLALLQKVLSCSTYKNPLNIVNSQVRSVLAAMEKNWCVFLQRICASFVLCLPVKLVSRVEPSPVLAAVQL